VNAPLPGPSSITGAISGAISAVITAASAWLDGATAPTRSGSDNQCMKNESESMVDSVAGFDV